jgi:molybdopterin molybdotransferase
MISVTEARKIIHEHTGSLRPVTLPIAQAGGLVLAEDVYAPLDIPGFRQSSMDGYALSFDDWTSFKRLKIMGVIPAGSSDRTPLMPGHAVRIFTGAPLPPGADTVVIQEKVRAEKGDLIIDDDHLTRGSFVRQIGAEIQSGIKALSKGHRLTPASMGFLASIGIATVLVYPKPTVSIIITGEELQEPGRTLQYGQVYEANSHALLAALHERHIFNIHLNRSGDALEQLTLLLGQALRDHDVVLLTGGVSVGDFDFVVEATHANGVQNLFHKVRQRPAKPLFFGKKGHRCVFGLPGNPASGLTSFYEYVVPALGRMSQNDDHLRTVSAPLANSFTKPAGLTHFLKGYFDGQTVSILDGQESFRLSSFARANCLIQIEESATECLAGTLMEIHLIYE